MNRTLSTILVSLLSISPVMAQYAWQHNDGEAGKLNVFDNVSYKGEVQGSFSSGKTPLWLNANRYGLSSLDEDNGYLRGAIERPLATDSMRRWGVGYGIDLAVASHYTSKFIVQQAYVEARWLHGVLTVGSKQYPMELKNNRLSSGSQALGINARPVPQVRLALPKYWTIPALGRLFHFKGHISYGIMTDDNWQKDFTGGVNPHTKHVLYHSKAGYLMVGKPEAFPLTFEIGLEMATEFAGKRIYMQDGKEVERKLGGHGLKDFYHAFVPGGSDPTDGQGYGNIEGNQLGAWVARLSYDAPSWRASVYLDHYFDDHSQLLFLDFDGYGEGENYQKHEHHRYLFYPMKDMLLGGELQLKHGTWLKGVVVEFLHTKDQSGPIYHDRTSHIPDHIGGTDDYYNHGNYMGWQHWGQVMGNPLYRSPLYNDNGVINVQDNRFVAWHLGFDGQPTDRFDYRVLGSWQRGYGRYAVPYTHARHNGSFMVEGTYHFPHNWAARAAWGMDFGSILGHNRGLQLTIIKTGKL